MKTTFVKTKDFIGHSGQIFSIISDGDFIYSASADKFVTRWNLLNGLQDKFAIRFEKTPYSIQLISKNEKLVVGIENGDLHIFDLILRKELKFYQQHKEAVFYLLENKSRQHFYSADASGNIAVWNSQNLGLEIFLPFDCGKIRRMSLNFDETKLFLACQDGFIRVLETTFFNLIDEFYCHEGGTTAICIHPDNDSIILTGGKDARLKLWDLNLNSCLKNIPAHNFVLYDILSLNESEFVTISRDKSIKIWDFESFNVLQKIDFKTKGHKHSVNSIVKIDELTFATCSDDKTVKVFST